MPIVNDIHSQLNETNVSEILYPRSLTELQQIVKDSLQSKRKLATCGYRHSMGGQQFASDQILIDTTKLNKILSFDQSTGLISVEAGINWPDLIDGYRKLQGSNLKWGISQKQTGADRLSIGGAVSANAHGRGLNLPPMIKDVENLTVVMADGNTLTCDRQNNSDLFKLIVGGYGLFALIYSVTLRLVPLQILRRVVRVIDIEDAYSAAKRRIAEGYTYGDFQFDVDPASPDFLTKGVFSCYLPVPEASSAPSVKAELSPADWQNLLHLVHVDKQAAFQRYAQHYLASDGQLYYSDSHQLGYYLDDYHTQIDQHLHASVKGSELISELYVPTDKITDFLKQSAALLCRDQVSVIYGTIRLIAEDTESFLPWARQRYACIVLNLHVDHDAAGIAKVQSGFGALIDLALSLGGSFFLTYHSFASKTQLLKAYPQFPEFLKAKLRYDPNEIFYSNWYKKHKELLA